MILLSLLLAVAAISAPAEEAPEKTPLQLRAEAACTGFDQLGSEEEKRERQALLMALADTLETEGFDVHASHCLERAGIFSYQFAEYDEMLAIWDRGLEVARRSGDARRVAALLNASAIGVSVTGDDERALQLQLELVLKRQEIGDPRGEGTSWYNVAYSYSALYRVPEAIEAYRRALVLQMQAENLYGVALTRNALSNALFSTGRIEESMALADSAVADAERQGAPLLVGNALGARAWKKRALGRNLAALEDFERAREILVDGGVARVAASTAVNHARSLVVLGRCTEALELIEDSWPELDRAGARAELIWARATRGRALAACDREDEAREDLRKAIVELQEYRAELHTEIGRADSFRLAGAAYTDLAALESGAGAWALVEESSASILRDELGLELIELARFQEELAKIDAVALQFSTGTPEHAVVCLVTPTSIDARVIQIPRDFARETATAMQLLAAGEDQLSRPVLVRISDSLLSGLDLTAERLVLIPGGFAGIPFEALPYRQADLGEQMAVTYAPSATVFVDLQARATDTGSMLAMADPSIAESVVGEPFPELRAMRQPLRPLPEARREARHVASRNATVLEAENATRQRFVDEAERHAVFHFATHAVVDGSNPGLSSIVLAESELLEADAIEELELAADLVSLSGCSTADGYLVPGEGTLGLTRAFLVAGARSVVASWWDVEDGAARRFMELFYERLEAGEDRDRALMYARSRMAEEGYPARDRLAFALIGATGTPVSALQAQEASGPGIGLWAALIVAGLLVFWFRRPRSH